jgi:hypothetical protein
MAAQAALVAAQGPKLSPVDTVMRERLVRSNIRSPDAVPAFFSRVLVS